MIYKVKKTNEFQKYWKISKRVASKVINETMDNLMAAIEKDNYKNPDLSWPPKQN
jgi:hypothetical protein